MNFFKTQYRHPDNDQDQGITIKVETIKPGLDSMYDHGVRSITIELDGASDEGCTVNRTLAMVATMLLGYGEEGLSRFSGAGASKLLTVLSEELGEEYKLPETLAGSAADLFAHPILASLGYSLLEVRMKQAALYTPARIKKWNVEPDPEGLARAAGPVPAAWPAEEESE